MSVVAAAPLPDITRRCHVEDPRAPSEALEIATRHCVLSGRMRRVFDLQNHLVDQIQAHKSVFKRTRYHTIDGEMDIALEKVIAGGRKMIGGLHSPTSPFQCWMDSALCNELTPLMRVFFGQDNLDAEFTMNDRGRGYDIVYYGTGDRPCEWSNGQLTGALAEHCRRARSFDHHEWSLDAGSTSLTARDCVVIVRFRDQLVQFMDDCIDVAKRHLSQTVVLDLQRHRDHYVKTSRLMYDVLRRKIESA